MKLPEIRRGRPGIYRRIWAELCRVPIRPRAAELVDTSSVSTHAIEGVDGKPRICGRRSRALRECSQPLRIIYARPDDVRLVIEDEYVRRGAVLGVGRRLVHFDRADLEERFAERLVDGDERRGQTARAFEELAA